MKDSYILIGTIVFTILAVFGVAAIFSGSTEVGSQELRQIDPQAAIGSSPHTKGAELTAEASSAAITIVEFSDFQCPSCKVAGPIVENVLAKHPEVNFVYRHFPLDSIHPLARLAAQASEVAAEKGKFWEYHDILFENQQSWSKITSLEEATEVFAAYASEIDIDKAEFLERIASTEIKELVQEDYSFGLAQGVNSTPTFFVNGLQVSAPAQLEEVVLTFVKSSQPENSATPAASLTPEAQE